MAVLIVLADSEEVGDAIARFNPIKLFRSSWAIEDADIGEVQDAIPIALSRLVIEIGSIGRMQGNFHQMMAVAHAIERLHAPLPGD